MILYWPLPLPPNPLCARNTRPPKFFAIVSKIYRFRPCELQDFHQKTSASIFMNDKFNYEAPPLARGFTKRLAPGTCGTALIAPIFSGLLLIGNSISAPLGGLGQRSGPLAEEAPFT